MPNQPLFPETSKNAAGSANQTGTNLEKLKNLLASRKFWAALIGLALLVLKAFKPDIPVTEEQATSIVYILVAYILGTAIEDNGRPL